MIQQLLEHSSPFILNLKSQQNSAWIHYFPVSWRVSSNHAYINMESIWIYREVPYVKVTLKIEKPAITTRETGFHFVHLKIWFQDILV